ncbi:MAG TPA: hypothetical protein VFT82_02645 [Candidatus Paceibacterota bacterium]|nr:hypothetical protein [Candidatus Paceibacterota bacterium]
MPQIPDIETLANDREKFNQFVYTPFEEAISEIERRKTISIQGMATTPPEALRGGPRFVLFRHIATPNYEIRRFMSAADAAGFKPLILEYTSDIFLSLNHWKHSLGKLPFYKGMDKKGGLRTEHRSIIDFNANNRKALSDIKTTWNQGLVDFHHEFFLKHFPDHKDNIYDLSVWLKENGADAKGYYKAFLSLFLKNAVLFENFLLEGEELEFTKKIILPAFAEIVQETGMKPLIVALEPTEIEGDLFWLCHPHEERSFIFKKDQKQ